MTRDYNKNKAAARELADAQDELNRKAGRPKKPDGGGGGDDSDPGGGRGSGGLTGKPKDNNNIDAAVHAAITEALDEHLQASAMKLAEFQRIHVIYKDGNPGVDDHMIWEYRPGQHEEQSRSYIVKIMADLYMLAQDTKIGVPTPEKLEKGFKHLDKIQLEGMAHGDFGHVFGLFVEQWAGTFQSIIRAIARGCVSRAGFMTAIYDRTGSEHSILTKGETIPSIERRLKWKDGLHPGNGSIGILGDEDSYVFIEMLKKVLCLHVQLSSREWQ